MLVLALRDLPDVTVVGEDTAGSPTPPLARTLPNGWVLGVPMLDLVTPDGVSWSGVPIAPGVMAPVTGSDLDSGTDPGVAAALALLS
jgi:C-terminal processing protease CtpA/Prc